MISSSIKWWINKTTKKLRKTTTSSKWAPPCKGLVLQNRFPILGFASGVLTKIPQNPLITMDFLQENNPYHIVPHYPNEKITITTRARLLPWLVWDTSRCPRWGPSELQKGARTCRQYKPFPPKTSVTPHHTRLVGAVVPHFESQMADILPTTVAFMVDDK